MDRVIALDVFFYDKPMGVIAQLPGDRNVFTWDSEYVNDSERPIASLSFKDVLGNLIREPKSTRSRLSPFFSNLLPEGILRDYLASQAKVSSEREFYLLRALGDDLPGALTVHSSEEHFIPGERKRKEIDRKRENGALHFSLAGVQLKFSAMRGKGGRFTIPVNGVGGSWIIKLPSSAYPGVPENEFAMMTFAKHMGIDVPEIALLPIEQIEGIPEGFKSVGNRVYAIKRFDRRGDGEKIHIEDFAQVFGVYPEKKYSAASYRNIAEVIWTEMGEVGLIEFIRRFVFNAFIGNGDMHMKNWSLIYPDKKTPALAPAYDFVSTIPYLPIDTLALNFVDSKEFSSLTLAQFRRFAVRSGIPEILVLNTVQETARQFKKIWNAAGDFGLDSALMKMIDKHLRTIPLYSDLS